jgi:hypothetical protein
MKTKLLSGVVVGGLMLAMSAGTQANDIVDFLRAVNGVPEPRGPAHYAPVSRHSGYRGQAVSDPHHGHPSPSFRGPADHRSGSRMSSRDVRSSYGHDHDDRDRYDRIDLRNEDRGRMSMSGRTGRGPSDFHRAAPRQSGAQISFQVSTGSVQRPGYATPVYYQSEPNAIPLPPVPQSPVNPGSVVNPHCVGEIITCPVPLETCVRVKDECNIAPHAVPIVIAVRDPHVCEHEPHAVVFVQVFVPPCPPHSVTVSPCQTRVSLCYGDYEVDIRSRDGFVVVDYDN